MRVGSAYQRRPYFTSHKKRPRAGAVSPASFRGAPSSKRRKLSRLLFALSHLDHGPHQSSYHVAQKRIRLDLQIHQSGLAAGLRTAAGLRAAADHSGIASAHKKTSTHPLPGTPQNAPAEEGVLALGRCEGNQIVPPQSGAGGGVECLHIQHPRCLPAVPVPERRHHGERRHVVPVDAAGCIPASIEGLRRPCYARDRDALRRKRVQ